MNIIWNFVNNEVWHEILQWFIFKRGEDSLPTEVIWSWNYLSFFSQRKCYDIDILYIPFCFKGRQLLQPPVYLPINPVPQKKFTLNGNYMLVRSKYLNFIVKPIWYGRQNNLDRVVSLESESFPFTANEITCIWKRGMMVRRLPQLLNISLNTNQTLCLFSVQISNPGHSHSHNPSSTQTMYNFLHK